jgi:SWI/SNF-related matrix-associated actin-dependent regulator of chromatin subfamily A-like protein 1
MKITRKCPVCDKIAEVSSESRVSNLIVTSYTCGHTRAKRQLTPKDLELVSSDGKKPYQYQLDGASWAIRNNARVLIADEMGLGKTIQGLMIAHSDPTEFTPVLVVCKAGLKVQWMKEAFRWCGWLFQIIEYETDFLLPNVNGYIIGYDSLAYSCFTNKKGKVIERGMKEPDKWIEKVSPRLIILDECQSVKNIEAKRTRAVQKISRASEHLVALSGTPILNNAAEYYPVLNMIQPEKFPNKNAYIMRWCDSYFSSSAGVQKVGGIKDVKGFKEFTKDFIIRRTRKEVLPDLPTIDRRFRFEELGEKVGAAYKEEFKKFQDYYYYSDGDSQFQREGNILAYLSRMRHLTGIAKIPGVVEFVEEFIVDTDRKIVVFTHHIDVANEVVQRLNNSDVTRSAGVLSLAAPVNPDIVSKFWEPNYRIMVASTLAAGEGLNLQCCSDCIIMERQWNPPKEEQAESRFIRIGQLADKVTATYFVAIATVDEFFADLVEQKRAIFSNTIEGKEIKWNESALIKELAEILAQKGGKKWGI